MYFFKFFLFTFSTCICFNAISFGNPYLKKTISSYTDSIANCDIADDLTKERLGNQLEEILISQLNKDSSYLIKLDSIKYFGVIYSPDNKFRLLQWNYIQSNGDGRHYGIIQTNPDLMDYQCTPLTEIRNRKISKDEILYKKNKPSDWYGALYYSIIYTSIKNSKVYTLLGIRYQSLFTTQKVIESIEFDKNGKIQIGIPIFKIATKVQSRVIFEYSNKVAMGLKYYSKAKRIVFDHLSPDIPLHTGNYMFYGPDFSYDAFEFDGGHWVFFPNIDYKQQPEEIRKQPKPGRINR